jgi:hypothetical protein
VADPLAHILTAVRRLDEEKTLRGILDALADAAASAGLHVAVLLVDRSDLRVYRHHGFASGDVPQQVAITASVAISQALVTCRRIAVAGDRASDSTPPFLRPRPGRHGLILPLVVDQSAVALVFVDGPADIINWGDVVEVLVRHGSARLESVTSQRTVEALTASL